VALFVAFATLVSPSQAQPTADYTIGVGDVLGVKVWQRDTLGGEFTVDSQGYISLPLVGAIRAAGQTAVRLAEELTRRFSFVERDVSQVTVSIVQYNSRKVFVMGEVTRPGAYAFAQIPGVWEVIREAGGPTPDATLTRVRIVPPEGAGAPQIVDLEQVLSTGDFTVLPPLRAGSTILVPRAEAVGTEGDVIFVYGRVIEPGTFSIDAARTVLQAVLAAGGPLGDADMGSVRVIRPGPVQARVIEVDLNSYTNEGELFANVPLLPGDTVTIPRSSNSAIWSGVRDVAEISGNILGTLFFFLRLNDDDNNNNNNNTDTTTP
jgi:polysaccharide export outer membrane protein